MQLWQQSHYIAHDKLIMKRDIVWFQKMQLEYAMQGRYIRTLQPYAHF